MQKQHLECFCVESGEIPLLCKAGVREGKLRICYKVSCYLSVSAYLVNDVIPKVLGRQDKHSVEDVSGLFNQLLPPAMVVVLSLQPRNLRVIPQ